MSKFTVSDPIITEEKGHGSGITQRINHPSFAQIQVSRINGHRVMYDSDFNSHNYIGLRISKSELKRDLSHDWHHEKDELIEVCMSEAQWATMVSSLNTSGTPCTLTYLMGKQIDRLPEPTDRVNQFNAELSKHWLHAVEQLTEAQALVATLGLSKAKAAALESILNKAKSNISGNAQFVEKSFNEHMENSVEKAKCEANAYLYHVVQRAGLDALTLGIAPPKQIEYIGNEQDMP